MPSPVPAMSAADTPEEGMKNTAGLQNTLRGCPGRKKEII